MRHRCDAAMRELVGMRGWGALQSHRWGGGGGSDQGPRLPVDAADTAVRVAADLDNFMDAASAHRKLVDIATRLIEPIPIGECR